MRPASVSPSPSSDLSSPSASSAVAICAWELLGCEPVQSLRLGRRRIEEGERAPFADVGEMGRWGGGEEGIACLLSPPGIPFSRAPGTPVTPVGEIGGRGEVREESNEILPLLALSFPPPAATPGQTSSYSERSGPWPTPAPLPMHADGETTGDDGDEPSMTHPGCEPLPAVASSAAAAVATAFSS